MTFSPLKLLASPLIETRLKKMNVRFSTPMYPGETICTKIWNETDSTIAFRARVLERDTVVINNGNTEQANLITEDKTYA